MKRIVEDLAKLQAEINREWENYKQALTTNMKSAEIKEIYLRIKNLEKEIDILMNSVNKRRSNKQK